MILQIVNISWHCHRQSIELHTLFPPQTDNTLKRLQYNYCFVCKRDRHFHTNHNISKNCCTPCLPHLYRSTYHTRYCQQQLKIRLQLELPSKPSKHSLDNSSPMFPSSTSSCSSVVIVSNSFLVVHYHRKGWVIGTKYHQCVEHRNNPSLDSSTSWCSKNGSSFVCTYSHNSFRDKRVSRFPRTRKSNSYRQKTSPYHRDAYTWEASNFEVLK